MRAFTFAVFFLLALVSTELRAEIVTLGISTIGLYELPTEIAKRKGFYQEEGLEVRKITIRTGIQVAALIAGELDYSTVSGIVSSASIQGLPLKTVMGWLDKPLHMLIARPGIKTLADLKGKRIAVSNLNSVPHVAVREALIQAGMNPDKDVTFLALGGSSERVSALAAGSADASPVDLAYIQKSEEMGFTDLLYLGDAVNIRLGGLGVTQDKIQKNPEQIKRMIRATLKGVRFMRPNKNETLAIMRDYLKISGDSVEKIYQYALRSLNEDGLVAKKTVDTEIRIAREQFKIKEDIPESKIFDWRFMKEIQAKK
ncbi:MAG TPA: ABC transporter substrate-binding protein [Candidatus Binatia bacterium]|jgi:NitT/TauT family transport system substrate-binding protein|nr:ABC transporter substrate-binding protein [Candidatus Binatia bacterium]